MQINMDLTVAMPCHGKMPDSEDNNNKPSNHFLSLPPPSFCRVLVLLVHVYDVSGQRMQLTENLKLVPVSARTLLFLHKKLTYNHCDYYTHPWELYRLNLQRSERNKQGRLL